MWQSLGQDLRYALSRPAHYPGLTLTATLELAPGMGANTAAFNTVNAVLLHPLPCAEADRPSPPVESNCAAGRFPLTGQDCLERRERKHRSVGMAIFPPQEAPNANDWGSLGGVREALTRGPATAGSLVSARIRMRATTIRQWQAERQEFSHLSGQEKPATNRGWAARGDCAWAD